MKTATEDVVFLTVTCRDSDQAAGRRWTHGAVQREAAGLASVPSELLWHEANRRALCLVV